MNAVALNREPSNHTRMRPDDPIIEQCRLAFRQAVERRRSTGVSLNAWANEAGVSEATLRGYLKGKTRSLTGETYVKLARAAGVTPGEIMESDEKDATVSVARRLPQSLSFNLDDEIVYADRSYVPIGVFDVHASAGPGAINPAMALPETFNLFRLEWLRRVTATSSDNLSVLRVSGDSMEPTLYGGDHVLVDRTVITVRRPGLYVIRHHVDDELMVKRVQRNPRGLFDIISDNPLYPLAPDVGGDGLAVHGQVIWLGRNVGG